MDQSHGRARSLLSCFWARMLTTHLICFPSSITSHEVLNHILINFFSSGYKHVLLDHKLFAKYHLNLKPPVSSPFVPLLSEFSACSYHSSSYCHSSPSNQTNLSVSKIVNSVNLFKTALSIHVTVALLACFPFFREKKNDTFSLKLSRPSHTLGYL